MKKLLIGLVLVLFCAGLLALGLPGSAAQGSAGKADTSKYGKNIVDHTVVRPAPAKKAPEGAQAKAKSTEQNVEFPLYVDEQVVPGAYYFMAAWWKKITGKGSPAEEHDHNFDEYLIFLGTKNANDLGGEVELWIGGEKHILTKNCAVFIPAGVKHAPIYFRRIDTPIWYLATGPTEIYKKAIAGQQKKAEIMPIPSGLSMLQPVPGK